MSSSRSNSHPAVLVTGAGGAAVPALIEHLRAKAFRVVAVDADGCAAGLYVADVGYRIPLALDPGFSQTLARICRGEQVVALVPLVDEELLPVAQVAEELGIPLIAPRPSFTALCLDKYALMQRLSEAGISVPESRLMRDGWQGMPFPLVLKPRTGRGSRGVRIAATPDELKAYVLAVNPDPERTLIQRCI
jgi:carbamoyl-phosphate synthase large subunit